MLMEYTHAILANIEQTAASGDMSKAMTDLRALSLDDFGLTLLYMPHPRYPVLSALLPRMASKEVQNNWTGSNGEILLKQSLNFVRSVRTQYEALTGNPLSTARILDYGCGYGRLLRLMMKYADKNKLHGCDPWDESIKICQEDGIDCNLKITNYLPQTLPYENGSLDLVYAFSVFTHTSLRATQSALDAIRPLLSHNGLLVITIRPIEYWNMDERYSSELDELRRQHQENGFAYRPHKREAVDGDVTYGDTSMTFEFLKSITPRYEIAGYDRSLDDPFQTLIYLKPV